MIKTLSGKTIAEQIAGRNALQRRLAEDAGDKAIHYLAKYKNVKATVLPLYTAASCVRLHILIRDLAGETLFESIEDPDTFPSELLVAKLTVIS
ncbi:hypothetical protein [Pseudolabrys sp.]|uniref:hypothetical protein n=1 Tax=Pseudolabrys sp. TaxID=1960880 RepID=UPI003D0D91B0